MCDEVLEFSMNRKRRILIEFVMKPNQEEGTCQNNIRETLCEMGA